jgi:hypothetical protein
MSSPIRINSFIRVGVAALAAFLFFAGPLRAQTQPYAAVRASYNFVDIHTDGTAILKNTDDETQDGIGIGFTFTFFNQTYTTACIAMNGTIAFGGCVGDRSNQDLTSGVLPNDYPVIAPLWTDLWSGADSVYYETIGTAPSRQFVVQWNNVFLVGSTTPITFQAILYETSNKVLFQYKTIAGAGKQATVGVRDTSGQMSGCRNQWSYDADVLTDSSAVLLTPAATLSPVPLTVGTTPSGSFTVDSAGYFGSLGTSWTPCSRHTLAVPTQTASGGARLAFSSWNDGGAQSHMVYAPTSNNALYTATLGWQYLLTVLPSPTLGGTVAANPTSADGYYNSGASVSLTATTNTGYQFGSYTGGGLSGSTVTMSAPETVTANFTTLVPVTIQTSPAGMAYTVGGVAYSNAQTFTQAPGTTIAVTITAPQTLAGVRYGFSQWADNPTAPLSRTFTVGSSSATYTANFVSQYPLAVTVSPAGDGTVGILPTSSDGYYNAGTQVTLTANPSGGWAFSSFSGDATGTVNPTTVTMNGIRTVTANFVQKVTFTVNTSPSSGPSLWVDSVPCPCSNLSWTPGSTHTLTVQASQNAGTGARYAFSGWSDGGAASHTITAPATSIAYTASFQTQYLLTLNPGAGGTLTANPLSALGDGYYPAGTVVQINATAGSNAQFAGFTGGTLSGTTNPQNVTMNAAVTVGASFTTLISVTIASAPETHRAITVDGAQIVTPQTFSWAPGSPHPVSVAWPQTNTATSAYLFTTWSDSGAATHTITPATGGTYTANFQLGNLLTLAVSPPGSGTITASPAAPGSYYVSGASVQITAAPNSGMVFSSFGPAGDLTGTTNPQTLTMTAAKSVTANFTAAQTGPTRVDSKVSITSSGLVYNRATGIYTGTLTIKNTSASAIAGPIEIVFSTLNPGVSVANATGQYGGKPFFIVAGGNSLAAGQSATVSVQYLNPSNAILNYTLVVYSGGLN